MSSLLCYDSKSPNNVSMGMGGHRGAEGKEEKERSIVKGCQNVVGPNRQAMSFAGDQCVLQ